MPIQQWIQRWVPQSCWRCEQLGAACCAACMSQLSAKARDQSAPLLLGPRVPIWAMGAYEPPLDRRIISLKYQQSALAFGMVQSLLACQPAIGQWCAAHRPTIVGVPSYVQRLIHRGYNPAAQLAQALALQLDRPHKRTLLTRVGEPRSQQGLSAAQRRQNTEQTVLCASKIIAPGAVLLVDDVMTTGATLWACYKALTDWAPCPVAAVVLAWAKPPTPA
jgi:ComF family protein